MGTGRHGVTGWAREDEILRTEVGLIKLQGQANLISSTADNAGV